MFYVRSKIPDSRVMLLSVSKIERLNRELQSAVSSGDLELALAVTDDMVDIDPDSSRHHTSRGVVLAKLDRTDEALEEMDEALALDVDDERAWYSKGCVLMDIGRPRPALACFYKSLDLGPGQLKARDRFLKCLALMQEGETAVEDETQHEDTYSYSQAEETQPASEEVTPSWTDMIQTDDDSDPEGGEAPVIERPPLPDEEPDLSETDHDGSSLLDDDMFDETEPDEDFEDWGVEDEEEDEGWGEDDESVGVIKCRCGSDIPIFSEERPYRFECPECGRTGTLR